MQRVHTTLAFLMITLCTIGSTTTASAGVLPNVTLSNPSSVAQHAMTLEWTVETDSAGFKEYRLYRSTSATVTTSSSLIATITSRATVSFRDTLLTGVTRYYYRVFVVDTSDTINTGSNTVNAITLPNEYPFLDSMEGRTDLNYTPTSPWGLDSTNPHSGSHCWTDSPLGNYAANADVSLTMHINLATATMPIMKFWTKYGTQVNADYGRVEVTTGSTWTTVAYFSGSQSTWKEIKVDLCQWAGNSDVTIRFRMQTNGDTQSDGWYIDDLSIAETTVPSLAYPFFESFDDSTTYNRWSWAHWDLVTDGRSLPRRIHDSPVGPYLQSGVPVSYTNNPLVATGMVTSGVIDFSAATNPVLTFWQKLDMKNGDNSCNGHETDAGRIYISTNFGLPGTWTLLYGATGLGQTSTWQRVELNLAAYAGSPNVRLLFNMEDSRDLNSYCGENSGGGDGWWIDDIRIENRIATVTLLPLTNVSMHGATLAWTQNTDADFMQYEIYRNTSSSVNRSSQLIATITNQTTTSYRDISQINQPGKFYYVIYVMDSLGTPSFASNIVAADYSVPTVTFPFTDSVEVAADTVKWNWGSPWGRTTARTHNGSYSWTDSPDASYAPNSNSSLTTFLNMSGSTTPVLTFWHYYNLELNADYGYVEVSTDNGSTWTAIYTVTGVDTAWNQQRIDMSAYIGNTIGLRFRVASNASVQSDGWYIDDIAVTNGTQIVGIPFSEGFESGVGPWFLKNPWGLTNTAAHGGSYSMTESPGGSYSPTIDADLLLHINLSGATMPILKFWTRYSTQVNGDYGRIEVSTGTGWTIVAYITGSQSDWKEIKADLTPWAGNNNVQIRFRFLANGDATVSDGWYLDDISITERTVARYAYPFYENFDDTTTFYRWTWAQWDVLTGGHTVPGMIHDSPLGPYIPSGYSASYSNDPHNFTTLITNNVIDLSTAVNPVLTFYQKYDMKSGDNSCGGHETDYGRVYISTNYGLAGTWANVYNVTGSNHTSTWERVELDLSPYAGNQNVRLIFVMDESRDLNSYCGDNSSIADGWWIDDIRLENRIEATTLAPAIAPSMHSATLAWSKNTNPKFKRYELYRKSSSSVDRSSTLIWSTTNREDTSFADVYQVTAPNKYYYRVYIFDTLDIPSFGSNIVDAPYSIPTVTFPFTDNVDSASSTAHWEWAAPWGRTQARAHSDSYSWTDSPEMSYEPNANTALTTNINLAGSTTPVLTFWNCYAFEIGVDFGLVEVSTDNGASWTTIHSVTGVDTAWNQERIDLSSYIGRTIGLRFRVSANASNQSDGWYIDDISVQNGTRIAGYPFFDNVESGNNVWFMDSPWGFSTVDPFSGTTSWTDSPAGNFAPSVDASLKLRIDLSAARMPVLKFRTRYGLQVNADIARVEINSGSGWTILAYFSGSQSTWKEIRADLSLWAGQSDVLIRFRLVGNGDVTVSDGWYLDDISVAETTIPTVPYPLIETFDDSTSGNRWNWAQWEVVPGGRSGPGTIHDSPRGQYLQSGYYASYSDDPNSFTMMATAGTLDLSHAVNPVLTFFQKSDMKSGDNSCGGHETDYGRVYVSTNYGLPGTWVNIYNITGSGQTSTWTKIELSLIPYIGPNTRIMFVMDDSRDLNSYCGENSGDGNGWWIDDIRIGENVASMVVVDSAYLETPKWTSSIPGQPTERIYGLAYEPGKTNSAGQGTGLFAQVGLGLAGTYPNDTTWTWFNASYLNDAGIYDRYVGVLTAPAVGSYDYAFRFSIDGGAHWIYADLNGNCEGVNGSNAYSPANAGRMIVSNRPDMQLTVDSISITLPLSQRQNWSFIIANDGANSEGQLGYNIIESSDSTNPTNFAWMTVQPQTGSIPSKEKVIITVTFDATGLKQDTLYTGVLVLNTNDPDKQKTVIPVRLMTSAASASASLSGSLSDFDGGAAIATASIELFVDDSLRVQMTSDARGIFTAFGVPPGTYDLRVVADGYYPLQLYGRTLPLIGANLLMSKAPVPAMTSQSANFYGLITVPVGPKLKKGDVVTAMDPQNNICGVSRIRTTTGYGFIHVYADDPTTTSVDEGASVGDTIRFFINELETRPLGPDAPVWSGDLTTKHVDLHASFADVLPLDSNWNLISFTNIPGNDSLQNVLGGITGRYRYVSGFDLTDGGARTFDPTLVEFSDLFFMNPYHGYWIKMNIADTLRVTGGRVYSDHALGLNQGWNLVSYLPEHPFTVATALSSIGGKYTIVSGFKQGAKTYVPGSEFNDLLSMSNGLGYWIKASAAATLIYGPMGPSRARSLPEIPLMVVKNTNGITPTPWWTDYYGTATTAAGMLEVNETIEAFDPNGVKCGEFVVKTQGKYGFLHVYGDDPTTTEVDEGAKTGDQISFYHKGLLIGRTPKEATWSGDKTPKLFNIDGVTGIADLLGVPTTYDLSQNYPNPFNPDTRIKYQLPKTSHVSLIVYDMLGKEVATIVDGVQETGYYSVVWSGKDNSGTSLASGIYFYRLKAEKYVKTLKLILLK